MVGQMVGSIRDIEVESSSEEDEDEAVAPTQNTAKARGVFSMFKGLVGSKALTKEDMAPVLEKMKDHLIAKNVAADIAYKLCESVAAKLEGKVSYNYFSTIVLKLEIKRKKFKFEIFFRF